ncbi:hypothetical protein I3F58_20370 [Streptomyces sp. MUM 203J]|uniref:hypothetical protein n=1 Tax=Streptomyces sp. MUM 203J TaxID=2791990 RepID=UPI001F03997D|nr:hypothetical protein [Streptomyces sp. MUM 203J]MCH0541880.1 hypothetical protein [Streptomyces sp. MUM 203J]
MPTCAVVLAVTATGLLSAVPATAHGGHDHGSAQGGAGHTAGSGAVPGEAEAIGREHAEEHARQRRAAQALVEDYPQSTRTARFKALTESQTRHNAAFDPAEFGAFREYFGSPDFGVHVAMLPTGKVLLFSFERIESNYMLFLLSEEGTPSIARWVSFRPKG